MKAFQFAKIDWRVTKSYSGRMLLLFLLVASLLYFMTDDTMTGIMYLYFGALIVSSIPFCVREDSESGFLLMLPSRTIERIAGRFLYVNLLVAATTVLGMGIAVITSMKHHYTNISFLVIYLVVCFSFCLIISGFQSLILYLAGELKSKQTFQWLRMLPGFLFFFGGSALVEILQDMTGLSVHEILSQPSLFAERIGKYNFLVNIISFVIHQPYISALIVFIVSVLLNSVCCMVSGIVVEKRS